MILVTLPEELPVSETIESAYTLEDKAGVQLGPVIVNACDPEPVGLDRPAADGGRGRRGGGPLAARPPGRARGGAPLPPGPPCRLDASRSSDWAASSRSPASSSRRSTPRRSGRPRPQLLADALAGAVAGLVAEGAR